MSNKNTAIWYSVEKDERKSFKTEECIKFVQKNCTNSYAMGG